MLGSFTPAMAPGQFHWGGGGSATKVWTDDDDDDDDDEDEDDGVWPDIDEVMSWGSQCVQCASATPLQSFLSPPTMSVTPRLISPKSWTVVKPISASVTS